MESTPTLCGPFHDVNVLISVCDYDEPTDGTNTDITTTKLLADLTTIFLTASASPYIERTFSYQETSGRKELCLQHW